MAAFNMHLQDPLLQEIEVLPFQVSATYQNSRLPAYSNVKPEMNQISTLAIFACMNLPILYSCKNEEN